MDVFHRRLDDVYHRLDNDLVPKFYDELLEEFQLLSDEHPHRWRGIQSILRIKEKRVPVYFPTGMLREIKNLAAYNAIIEEDGKI